MVVTAANDGNDGLDMGMMGWTWKKAPNTVLGDFSLPLSLFQATRRSHGTCQFPQIELLTTMIEPGIGIKGVVFSHSPSLSTSGETMGRVLGVVFNNIFICNMVSSSFLSPPFLHFRPGSGFFLPLMMWHGMGMVFGVINRYYCQPRYDVFFLFPHPRPGSGFKCVNLSSPS